MKQALSIAAVAFGPTAIAVAFYFLAKGSFSLPREIDGLVTLAAICIAGVITTLQAKKYGVRKTGWLGVGAKTAVPLIVLSWLFYALSLATQILA